MPQQTATVPTTSEEGRVKKAQELIQKTVQDIPDGWRSIPHFQTLLSLFHGLCMIMASLTEAFNDMGLCHEAHNQMLLDIASRQLDIEAISKQLEPMIKAQIAQALAEVDCKLLQAQAPQTQNHARRTELAQPHVPVPQLRNRDMAASVSPFNDFSEANAGRERTYMDTVPDSVPDIIHNPWDDADAEPSDGMEEDGCRVQVEALPDIGCQNEPKDVSNIGWKKHLAVIPTFLPSQSFFSLFLNIAVAIFFSHLVCKLIPWV